MKIRVELEVPDDIAKGLLNGTLERVGGVIRFADSKQVVAWLREGGNMSRNVSSGMNLLPSLLRAAGMNAKSIAVVAGAVTIAGPLLDVGITAFTIYRLQRRIESLKQEIADIYDRLDQNFEKAKAAKLDAALYLAGQFLNAEDIDIRRGMLHGVIQGLVLAEKELLQDISSALNENKLSLAGKLIDCAISVDTMAARCADDFGQQELAINSLKENVAVLRPHVDRLLLRLVGGQPALYFHRSVSEDYLDRYMQIRAWLSGEKDVWETVAKEARKNFWNEKAIKRLFRERRRFLHVWHEQREDPFYIEALPRAEELIESFQRFESYALDLESPDRPSRDLETLSAEAAQRLADHDDYVLLIDEDALGRVGRLSA